MKKMNFVLVMVTVLLLVNTAAFGQMQMRVKEGVYISFEEFKNNSPKFTDGLLIEKRSKTNILLWGGNDYEVKSTNKAIVKKEIWGVFQKDTLYLNLKEISGANAFARVEIADTYSLLRIGMPGPKYRKELGINMESYMFGGGIGGGIQGGKMAMVRIPLVYNMESGKRWVLSKNTMLLLLEGHGNLKSKYDQEPNNENEEVLIEYLSKLNEIEYNKKQ